jgi:hypothetical protein
MHILFALALDILSGITILWVSGEETPRELGGTGKRRGAQRRGRDAGGSGAV